MLSNTPGNIGFEAAPFKLPLEYVEILGGEDGQPLREFRKLFHEGFEAARKHCDRIVTVVELMQKGTCVSLTLRYNADEGVTEDSTLPCFAASGEQTAAQLRERFQQALTHSLVVEHVDKLIDTSLGSTWTRLYDSVSLARPSIVFVNLTALCSISTILSPYYDHCPQWHILYSSQNLPGMENTQVIVGCKKLIVDMATRTKAWTLIYSRSWSYLGMHEYQ